MPLPPAPARRGPRTRPRRLAGPIALWLDHRPRQWLDVLVTGLAQVISVGRCRRRIAAWLAGPVARWSVWNCGAMAKPVNPLDFASL
jgi:hypothetical protein